MLYVSHSPNHSSINIFKGFSNRKFSRAVRLNPNETPDFKLVRYELQGTRKEFEGYQDGLAGGKRKREAWTDLVSMLTSPFCLF